MARCPIGTDVGRAAGSLRTGRLVAFPTETVYGLGAHALDPRAVVGIFEVKGRPRFDPLIVHVADRNRLPQLAADVPEKARLLAERFWPGPLTLVLPRTETVPDLVTAGLPTVAVRVPDHPLALEMLRTADLPVAAPSANAFGRISPTTAEHVAEQLGERIDYILDGGPCRVGVESTVLQIGEASATLLRPGGLPVEEIESVIGPVHVPGPSVSGEAEPQPEASPGRLPRHYAPRTPLRIVADAQALSSALEQECHADKARRLGLLTRQAVAETTPFAVVEVLSPTGDLVEAAANFFAALRRLDAAGLDLIVALPFPEEGLGRALNDRLRRASHL